jgi:hypothetical protein
VSYTPSVKGHINLTTSSKTSMGKSRDVGLVHYRGAHIQGAYTGRIYRARIQGAYTGRIYRAHIQGAYTGRIYRAHIQGANTGRIYRAHIQGAYTGRQRAVAIEFYTPQPNIFGPSAQNLVDSSLLALWTFCGGF